MKTDERDRFATRIVSITDVEEQTIHLRRCRLVRTDPQGEPQVYLFDQPIVRIGSLNENDVVVDEDTVSRFHCQIVQEEDNYILKDLASTNGTYLDGVRIREAFLTKGSRIKLSHVELAFEPIEEHIRVEPANLTRYGEIVGQNLRMRQIFNILERISPSAATVILEGETGTGKEVVARTIHNKSNRSKGPFIVFDCGAVPENLIESELFGHEKGAFTGALRSRQGLFQMAHRGTIFLDEIGELSLDLQPKLLRVLETREVRSVGSNRSTPVDVRVIAATNRDLAKEVREGRFREDLFYRLSVVRLLLPPLRERPDDIPLLVEHFLSKEGANRTQEGYRRLTAVSAPAMRALEVYSWPGNVRELANVVERACSFAKGPVLEIEDLPDHIAHLVGPALAQPELHDTYPDSPVPSDLAEMSFKDAKETWLATFEKDYLAAVLKKNDFNISASAREASIDRKYFRKLMQKYGLETPGSDQEP
ncbi:MAG: sigma 54-interacting transcriptional regulator [Bradymonadales bacterium]|nr:sigma 54-interacting transcriptional regulator [Bradymonadales bacterium]